MTFSDKLVVFIAQGFGIGRIPFAPGTWGTLLGLAYAAVLMAVLSEYGSLFILFTILVGTVLLSVVICRAAERILKQEDPGSVVLDEIVAVPVCFLWILLVPTLFPTVPDPGVLPITIAPNPPRAPFSGPFLTEIAIELRTLRTPVGWILYFLLFRLFDIWKPWPVRQSQALPGGWGVVMDDVLAAVYVNLVALALYGGAYFLR
jgi:phosphatidylglycerophosphatase A